MSTTNPPPGHDPVGALAPRQPGSPTPDDSNHGGGPSQAVIQRGYEADGYDTKSVISVPVLVIGFFVLAFTCVTILFAYFRHGPDDPLAHPQAVEANSKSLNERIAATPKRGRPEPLQMENDGGGNPRRDPRAITRPPVAEGNPPEFHPEQIRPSPVNTPTLYETKWLDGNKFARVPIDDATTLWLKSGVKVREGATPPTPSYEVPSGSNAGRGLVPGTPAPAKDAKEGKH
jgi:hypothetical protein